MKKKQSPKNSNRKQVTIYVPYEMYEKFREITCQGITFNKYVVSKLAEMIYEPNTCNKCGHQEHVDSLGMLKIIEMRAFVDKACDGEQWKTVRQMVDEIGPCPSVYHRVVNKKWVDRRDKEK